MQFYIIVGFKSGLKNKVSCRKRICLDQSEGQADGSLTNDKGGMTPDHLTQWLHRSSKTQPMGEGLDQD